MKGSLILKSPVILSETVFVSRRTCGSPRAATRSLRRNKREATLLLALALLLSTLAAAQTLTGTVKNSTTGKPAAGDDVVLLSLGQGMEEAGRTKADAKGNFSFKLDAQGPHLIRVIHQDVTYHRMAPPGTTSVEVEVYDVGKKIEGIEIVADVMRIQVEQGQLEIMRQFAVENKSQPPRTQMNEHNLEFYVPDGAQIVEGSAMTEGGNPLNTAPVPEDEKKTKYAFVFPLRPGTTQFEVAYQLPYTGSANIDPKSIYPLQHFVAMLPKSIQFDGAPGTNYKVTPYPKEPDANVQVASNIAAGQSVAFRISGEGVLKGSSDNGGGSAEGGSTPSDNRPGGGLGPPIDAPAPFQKYQWYILGGFAVLLAGGGIFVASKQQAANSAARAKGKLAPAADYDEDYEAAEVPAPRDFRRSEARPQSSTTRSSSSMLLEGLKEELFQLEVEHKQGSISQQEYEQAKSALDQTLQRALRREAAKQT